MSKILVTGAAGFIGFHVAQRLLGDGHEVVGIDNLNEYYDPLLKQSRLNLLAGNPGFHFEKMDICDRKAVEELFKISGFFKVVHLAAQVGVRYSIANPHAYIDCNISGFLNILEGCRHYAIQHLVFASSSSVYGANTKMPFSEHDPVDHPVSPYAATKKSNELMAHVYAHLYGIPTTGLRFFTVYGPWGRPDMALFLFTRNILEGKPIDVFNQGFMKRDFTYIDDVVEGIVGILSKPPIENAVWASLNPDPATSKARYRIYNIGSNNPVTLNEFIIAIESAAGKRAIRVLKGLQAGDLLETSANVDDLAKAIDFKPMTKVQDGVKNFVKWYRSYYAI